MTTILGLGGSIHDFGSCLISADNQLVAIADERLTGIRHNLGASTPYEPSLKYCLDSSGLHLSDVSLVVADDMIDQALFPVRLMPNHHLMHAYSALFTSPFMDAAILVVDGVGSLEPEGSEESRETTTFAYGTGNQITTLGAVYGSLSDTRLQTGTPRVRSNSLGEFYRAVTQTIGFDFLQAGKTMGLFPYGDDRFVEQLMDVIELGREGRFSIQVSGERGLLKVLERIRHPHGADLFFINASIAFAAQRCLEHVLNHCIQHLKDVTRSSNLCIVGGVALNSVANGVAVASEIFDDIYVPFAPGDEGVAIGAALFGSLAAKGNAELFRAELSPYLGRAYTADEVRAAAGKWNVQLKAPSGLQKYIAEKIHQNKIVAWFQSGSEFGPRALGHRSLLADPSTIEARNRLNAIKGREWFRPVAPIVIEEEMGRYFDALCPAPWMQFVFPVKQDVRARLAGCTHVDGSARVQSLRQADNPALYELLEQIGELSGVPVLINTSFNTGGRPIVETPYDAIDTFLHSGIDILVMDGLVLEKQ